MKKRFIGTAVIMTLTLAVPTGSYAQDNNAVTVNGEQILSNCIMENDRLLVPANGVFEKLGAEVKWDREKAEVLIEDNYSMVELFIDKKEALVYKKYDFTGIPLKATLDVAPRVIDNTVYVPLRFVAESINASVKWDSDKNEAVVSTKKGNTPVPYDVVSQNVISNSTALSKWYDENKANKGIYFTKENDCTYVMITGGKVNTGGYTININGIVQDTAEGLNVYASIVTPSKDATVIQVISYPCIIIKFQNNGIKYVNGVIY